MVCFNSLHNLNGLMFHLRHACDDISSSLYSVDVDFHNNIVSFGIFEFFKAANMAISKILYPS